MSSLLLADISRNTTSPENKYTEGLRDSAASNPRELHRKSVSGKKAVTTRSLI